MNIEKISTNELGRDIKLIPEYGKKISDASEYFNLLLEKQVEENRRKNPLYNFGEGVKIVYRKSHDTYIEFRNSLAERKIENRKYLNEHEGKEFLVNLVWINYKGWIKAHKSLKRERRKNLLRKLSLKPAA